MNLLALLPPFYLEGINPLRGLDLPTLIARIEQGERGYYALLQWTYRSIEKRSPIVRAVKRRLMASLGALKWDIKLADVGEDAAKKALAEKQAKDLRAAYDQIKNLRHALNFLALADLRGFSHLEKIYRSYNSAAPDAFDVLELRIVEQWFWSRRGRYAPWLYNPNAQETNSGTPIDPANFIIHSVDDPADEIFAEMETKRRTNDADWDGFLEDYGVPPMFIEGPPNVSRDREAEYQRTAELAVSRARGYLPNGSKLQTPSATGSGGASVFSERLKYLDEQIVLAGTSGKLTVLTESGSGTLSGGAQKEAFDEIAQAIAEQISSIMQDQFDRPFLARKYPNDPALAYFEFAAVDKEQTGKVLEEAKTAADAGYRIDDGELSEKTGWKLTFVGRGAANAGDGKELTNKTEPATAAAAASATSPAPSIPPANKPVVPPPDPEQLNALFASAIDQLAQAEAADLEPLRRALETAATDPAPEKLLALLDQLAAIQSELGTRGEEVRKNIFGTSLVTGLTA